MTYNHDTIHEWVQANFLHNKTKYSTVLGGGEILSDYDKVANSLVGKLSKKLIISGSAEFCHVSMLLKLSGNNSHIGFNNVKIKLEQALEPRGNFVINLCMCYYTRHVHKVSVV